MLGPIVVDIEGTRLTAEERRRLRHPLVGQVILFGRNYESADQLTQLTSEIHGLRDPPLLICVDHEGGRVQRFRAGFSHIDPMARLGEQWDRNVLGACDAARSTGFVMAAELRAHGVDLSLAPVLDLNWGRSGVIGDRAMHSDPRVVTLLASHLVQGMALAGMACCGKHFPGHGWTQADSHDAVPIDDRSLEEILGQDGLPYRCLGIGLSSVMPAHVIYTAVDAQPTGFSARWIKTILRGTLGFSGAVYSDDLSMVGASAAGDVVARAQAALAAGCDFALVCNDPAAADQVLNRVGWNRTQQFEQRLARVRPVGLPLDRESLAQHILYQAALRGALAQGPA
jgi:beta-N-acetylhexosaminidase